MLFLCQTLPYPPDAGMNIRTYNILKLLARDFDIEALCFYRRGERSTAAKVAESVAALSALARVRAFPIPQEHSRLRLLADHAESTARRQAYVLQAYESRAFRRAVQSAVAQGVDLVHVDSLDLAGYLPRLRGLPVVVTHHNVESRLLRRRAQAEGARWRREYLGWQARWVENMERQWCGRVALNLTVSEEDKHEMERIAPGARFEVIPNGVDVETFTPVPGPQSGIVFVGATTWFPNRDALEYFSADILPLLRSAGDAPAITWIGRSSVSDQQQFRRHGIELTGYVDDVRPYIARAACYVVPLRVGGGTRLKILDAWAMGKAVVSTPVGCEGLAARDGDNILIRDTAAGFAEAIRQVMADAALRERLGAAARSTVERVYSWPVVGEKLRALYLPLAAGRLARQGAS